MWTHHVSPRFVETDALGHINNTVLPVWFEDARTPLFRLFTPDLDINNWHLIIAKIEVEFVGELFYGKEVEIRTYITRLGNSSMVIAHEAWQEGRMGARGSAVMVHFDHKAKQSVTIPEPIRAQLSEHLQTL
ncbi:MAG: acyl-CoA thioesterase [Saccharospirillaceae bacterium]|nr:acyl-CoA thioesterase [Saccharospirillaceae bacterium]MCD8531175.1 acyl-CoA thioesterase [Saccharospirillaceae bacterium]